jgi:hypothetical protein
VDDLKIYLPADPETLRRALFLCLPFPRPVNSFPDKRREGFDIHVDARAVQCAGIRLAVLDAYDRPWISDRLRQFGICTTGLASTLTARLSTSAMLRTLFFGSSPRVGFTAADTCQTKRANDGSGLHDVGVHANRDLRADNGPARLQFRGASRLCTSARPRRWARHYPARRG